MTSPSPRLRSLTFSLHILVTTLALLSLLTNRFDLWIDLRLLHPAVIALLKIAWVGTVLVLPFAAGPRLAWRLGRWNLKPLHADLARHLLWPTYILMACLLANSVYYYDLLRHNLIDSSIPIPITLAVFGLLAAWCLAIRQYLRSVPRTETAPASRPQRLRFLLLLGASVAAGVCFFALCSYQVPLPDTGADLAIVLGYRVLPDGAASVTLADRTAVAIRLYQQGLVRHLFLSGAVDSAAHGPDLNEPAAMAALCTAAGIPDDALTLDPVGINTRATAANAAAFMQAHNLHSAVVCSSNYHLFRTVQACRNAGFSPAALPAVPSQWPCADLRDTLREAIGIVVYSLDPTFHLPKADTMHLANPRIAVSKSANTLQLFDGDTLVKTYPCITGSTPGNKEREGDRKTPLGNFHIVYKNPQSKFHLSLGIDYPTADDARRGLASGLISHQQYTDILSALQSDLSLPENQKKLWYTPLGGEIFLHGHANDRAGTAGCIALSNPDIEELYALLPTGTPITITP